LRAEGNGVCLQCHQAAAFDTPKHHFHQAGGAGAACVACHAPTVTYMVVDPRHDHSFRIPRPDLTETIGVPNACTGCHAGQSAGWAAAKVADWYGPRRRREPQFGTALAAERSGGPGWRDALIALAGDSTQPAIVRATALDRLGARLDRLAQPAVTAGLTVADPLMRLAATGAADRLPADQRLRALLPLTADPLRAIRLEAARLLAGQPLEALPTAQRNQLTAAFAEYETATTALADRPEGLVRRAEFRLHRGAVLLAEGDLRLAVQRYPDYVPAPVNLADLYRATGRDGDGERVLMAALARLPDDAVLNHALGLLRIRQQRYTEAADLLARAATAAPASPRYAFVAGLALIRSGRDRDADRVLHAARARHPNDIDLLVLLTDRAIAQGATTEARQYVERLSVLAPEAVDTARLRHLIGQMSPAPAPPSFPPINKP
jgi:Tfp pilus assembly protein PilF